MDVRCGGGILLQGEADTRIISTHNQKPLSAIQDSLKTSSVIKKEIQIQKPKGKIIRESKKKQSVL